MTGGPYHMLSVFANDPLAEIRVGDEDGHFVCKDVGWLREGLEAGTYVVQIGGLKAPKHYIHLESDLHLTEETLRETPMTKRKFIRTAAEFLAKGFIVAALGIICLLATKHAWAEPLGGNPFTNEGSCIGVVNPVACVTRRLRVGDDYGMVLTALGKPVAGFEAIGCPPGKKPGDAECITRKITIHIIGNTEFKVTYHKDVVEAVDTRPVPPAYSK